MTQQRYVQFGCGLCVGHGWVNYDASPTLRLQRLPLLGPVLVRAAGAVRFPREVRYGDICRGLLAPPRSCAGVYASHVLEHLSLEDFAIALRHTREMLAPGGIFRLVVPDLAAKARAYLAALDAGVEAANTKFLRDAHLGLERRPRGLMGALRSHLGNAQHLWMWDEPSLARALHEAGFAAVRRCAFHDSEDPMFRAVEDADRFVDPDTGQAELAMECRSPPGP